MSLAKLGQPSLLKGIKRLDMIGDKNPSWKGGITPENHKIRASIEFRLWREAVFARDNWTCQKCKKRGGIKIHPHHIYNFYKYPELRFAIDNGITFCEECHKLFHHIYGNRNNTKEQIEEFIKTLNNICEKVGTTEKAKNKFIEL